MVSATTSDSLVRKGQTIVHLTWKMTVDSGFKINLP